MRLDEHFLQTVVPTMEIVSHGLVKEYIFSIDTRTLAKGEIFVALQGQKVDGHSYIKDAIAKGAAGLVLAHDKKQVVQQLSKDVQTSLFIAVVADPASALVAWATAWRSQFSIPIIGITGSIGKTSTKEMLSNILRENATNFLASSGNQNTQLGLALNLLRLRSHHEVAIMEMGISRRGEMAELAAMVRPSTAIITTIGHSHMEGLGSLADIALEKRDIFKYFTEQNIGIINGDVPLLAHVGYIHPVVKFGTKTINQIQARKIQIGGSQTTLVLKLYKQKYPVAVSRAHEGVVTSILASSTAAHLLAIPTPVILKAIQKPLTVQGRFEILPFKHGNGTVINDCYNANPESMKAALCAFEKYETSGHKVAILGDMLELGVNSPFWHRQVGRFLRKVPSLKQVILVGDMVKWIKKTMPVSISVDIVPDWKTALDLVGKQAKPNMVVLIKGSQGMQLQHIVDALSQESSAPISDQQTTMHMHV